MVKNKQTNYEVIKNMSLPEMAATFYQFAKPFTELLNMTDEQKKEMQKQIKDFLNAEAGTSREA